MSCKSLNSCFKLLVMILVLVLMQLCTFNVQAQKRNKINVSQDLYTRFLNLTELNGLSNNKVLDIVQDNYGFLWIATSDGLNRFDGYSFKIYKHNLEDSLSISGNYITSLAFDHKHNLWIGTKNGLNMYDRTIEGFIQFPIQSQQQKGISNSYIRKVYSNERNGLLWVETVDGVLNKIILESNDVEQFKHKKISSTYYNYHSIFEDSEQNIWFGGRDIGPYKFDVQSNDLKIIKADSKNPDKKRDNDISCIFQDSEMRYWMSGTDGFYEYYATSDKFKKYLPISTFDIIEHDIDNLWLATGSGLHKFNKKTKSFISYKHEVTDNLSLVGNHVNCLLIDNGGNLWVGTSNGISIIEQKKNTFKFFRSLPEHEHSIPTSPVSDFLEDKNGNIWIATMGSGIINWDRTNNSFKSYADKFGNQKVSCLFEDKKGKIWIGLWSGTGFYSYDSKENQFDHYAIYKNSYKADWYNDFYEDSKGRLWAGVWGYKGVSVFDRDSTKFKDYSFRFNESPFNWPVYKLLVTSNKVWVSSKYNYLYTFNKSSESFECQNKIKELDVLPEWRHLVNDSTTTLFDQNSITGIISDKQGILYFATKKGLIQYSDHKFKLYKNVLSSINSISNIDERKFFYFSSGNHIYQYNSENSDVNLLVTLPQKTTIVSLYSITTELFIGTSNELLKCDLRSKELKKINGIEGIVNKVQNFQNLLFVASTKGFYILNTNNNELVINNLNTAFNKGLLSEYINGFYIDEKRGANYLATDKGLLKYDIRKNAFLSVNSFDNIAIYDIHSNNNDTIWLATEQGLANYYIKREKHTFYNQFTKHQSTSRLTKFIFEDSKKNVWIGSTNNGISRLNTDSYEFSHFLSDKDNQDKLWGSNTTCITELSDGRVVIGADGLNVYDYNSNAFSHFTNNNGLPSNQILGIVEDHNEHIWVSTPNGLLLLNSNFEILNKFHTDWGLEPYKFTDAMLRLNSGDILIGAKTGFYTINPEQLQAFNDSVNIQITKFRVFDKEFRSDFTINNSLQLNYDQNFFTIEFSDFNYQSSNPEFLYKLHGVDKDWVNSKSLNSATYTQIPHGKYVFEVKKKNQLYSNPAIINIEIKPPFWKTYWFMAIEVCVVLLILFLLYRQQINKYKMREKHLTLEQTLLRSQMNPHFVFNALIAIQSFIFKSSPKEAGRYLSKFAKLMRLFLQNTREEYINLSQELETLTHYLELQQLRFNESFDYTIACVDQIDPDLVKIPPMMAQPFIENAIEHGFRGIGYQGQIEIKYYIHDTYIRIVILDNGIGINASIANKAYDDSDHESLATEITRDRLKVFSTRKQKFDIEIIDRMDLLTKEQGTRVTIKVPFTNELYNG